MVTRLLRAIYDRYCLWRYGKTYTHLLEEYAAQLERQRSIRRKLRRIQRESADIDHNIYFGDR